MTDERRRLSQLVRGLGLHQAGDPLLHETTIPFDLPREAELANHIAGDLIDKATVVSMAHPFRDGIGLAAPQVGIGRSVVIVHPLGERPLTLFNPQVIDISNTTVEGYDECLSCFEVQEIVTRPVLIDVEHASLDGSKRVNSFRLGAARLAAHAIDHLHGIIYDSRTGPITGPVPSDGLRRPLAGRQR